MRLGRGFSARLDRLGGELMHTKITNQMRWALALGALLVVGTVILLHQHFATPHGARVVNVALYENVPKIYTNRNGQAAGLFPEILQAIASAEGWTLRYVPCKWRECIEQTLNGTLDLFPDLAFSSERAQQFDFHSLSVTNGWSQVYIHPRLKAFSLADLAGLRVAVLDDELQPPRFAKLMASGNYPYQERLVESLEGGFTAVLADEVDAVVSNRIFAAHYASVYQLRETPIIFLPSSRYFVTGKGRNADLLERIDANLKEWRRDANSIYFQALYRVLSPPPEIIVPYWVQYTVIGMSLGLGLMVAVTLLLRWQVKQRTAALVETTRALQNQRNHLESLVAERTAELLKAKLLAEQMTLVKSEFIAHISHEIRTPINAVLGMLYLALQQDLMPVVRNYLSKAQGAAHALLSLVNDVLDLSKIEAGKLNIECVEFEFDQVLEHVSDVISFQAIHKNLEFLIRHDLSIPSVLIGDPLRLNQILINLCGNAVKFTEHGQIELSVQAQKLHDDKLLLQICVRDSGIGISEDLQPCLFDKFAQGGQSDLSTTRSGSGLGLPICKQLLELMGGHIWLESTQLGVGTSIAFNLPLRISQRALAHREALTKQAGPQLRGRRVLVVDDNSVSREIFTQMLAFFQLEVGTASNAHTAIEMLANTSIPPYDLVIMDWRMPGMNGAEATRRIHHDASIVRKPKVVIVTAHGRDDVMQQVEDAGAAGFLIKPVSPSTLLDTLLSVLKCQPMGVAVCTAPPTIPNPAVTDQLRGMRLLLVEDNEVNREFANELLRSYGAVVDTAGNGVEALALVQQRHYDALLMDIQMPMMSGLEATQRIRQLANNEPRFAKLPIIAMSALAMTQDVAKSRAIGVSDYVTKPVNPERLIATICHWVRPNATPITVSATPNPMLPADLCAMSSVDVAQGVQRIGGNIAAYRRQLRRFAEHYADAATYLRSVAERGDVEAAAAYCHILKGVVGNLSASALYAEVSRLNTQLKLGQLPEPAMLETLEQCLHQVLEEIANLAADHPADAQPLDTAAILQRLELLTEALNYDFGSVATLVAELNSACGNCSLEAEMHTLAAEIDVFAIDEALNVIHRMQQHLKDRPLVGATHEQRC